MKNFYNYIDTFIKNDPNFVQKNAVRLFHGRGGCFPLLENINIDRFDKVILITIFHSIRNDYLNDIIKYLTAQAVFKGEQIIIQYRNKNGEGYIKSYTIPTLNHLFYATEDKLKYQLNLLHNQNSGFFIDARELRRFVRGYAKDLVVLNLFAYTCSISVAAIAGGAKHVYNWDMAKKSLNTGRLNHRLNQLSCTNVTFNPHNIFKSWGKIKKQGMYDLIIIDPPSNQGKSFYYKYDYEKVLKNVLLCTTDDAMIITCFNGPFLNLVDFKQLCAPLHQTWEVCQQLCSPEDFKEQFPSAGLKILFWKRKTHCC